jgi:hypothetical protein
VELLNITEAANTGKFNYHLKILGDLIRKDEDGKYSLTEKGQLALQFLQKFPEKKPAPTANLNAPDAALIGLAGVALVTVNPVLLIGLWLSLNSLTVPAFSIRFFVLGALLYGLLVPSFIMRFLTVKRTGFHDMYTLFRAPLFTFTILAVLSGVLFLTGLWLKTTVMIESPKIITAIGSNGTSTRFTETGVNLAINYLQGLVFSFLGVAIIEYLSRLRKRRKNA